ncbi:MAG: hypothetical protein K8T10_11535 [Candidatus Eremiobacteraeota bacterium]|nr:hypothetical protein [Candidatus Eremiobacteraeota bacterium]
MKKYIPWYMKITIKLALGNIPGMQKLASGVLPVFQQGPGKDPDYNINVYLQHFHRFARFNRIEAGIRCADYDVLELGPGRSLGCGVVANILGAKKVWLVDVEKWTKLNNDFAVEIMDRLRTIIESTGQLFRPPNDLGSGGSPDPPGNGMKSILNNPSQKKGLNCIHYGDYEGAEKTLSYLVGKKIFTKEEITSRMDEIQNKKDIQDYLLENCLIYSDRGMKTLEEIPGQSVSFTYSQAVLEHVKREDIKPILDHLHRITIPGGITSHVIDFRDHIGNSLHSLRFSEKTWESDLFRNSGFYTNRMRKTEIIKLFEESGWEIVYKKDRLWDKIPLDRKKLAPEFSNLGEEDLLCSGLVVVGRKRVS